MYPASTTYNLCLRSKDYKRCRALQRDTESYVDAFQFPTIYAERAHKITGFLGTFIREGIICAGPLVIEKSIPNTMIIAFRLCTAYENCMRNLGIKEFFFSIRKDHTTWLHSFERFGLTPHSEDETYFWFKRVLA